VRRPIRLISVGVCIAALAAAAPAAETYSIDLSTPAKVGDRYHLIAKAIDAKDETLSRAHGKTHQKIDLTVELDGIVKVRKVDSHGSGTLLDCTVNHLLLTEGGTTSDILPPGSVITTETVRAAAHIYQKSVVLQGQKLTPGQIELINKVLESKMPEAPTEQDIFGTATPQPLGGTWALNRERGVQYWLSRSIAVEPRDFTGKSQLAAIEKVGNVECLRVEGAMKASKFKSTYNANVQTEHGSLSLKYSMTVPRVPSLFQKTSAESHLDFSEKGTDDMTEGFRREVVEDIKLEMIVEPVK
jgi:hypothetical protein